MVKKSILIWVSFKKEWGQLSFKDKCFCLLVGGCYIATCLFIFYAIYKNGFNIPNGIVPSQDNPKVVMPETQTATEVKPSKPDKAVNSKLTEEERASVIAVVVIAIIGVVFVCISEYCKNR